MQAIRTYFGRAQRRAVQRLGVVARDQALLAKAPKAQRAAARRENACRTTRQAKPQDRVDERRIARDKDVLGLRHARLLQWLHRQGPLQHQPVVWLAGHRRLPHVSPPCFAKSPTALRYLDLVQRNVRLDAHHEPHADYDGLGVRWGIGHKKARWEDCEQACRDSAERGAAGPLEGCRVTSGPGARSRSALSLTRISTHLATAGSNSPRSDLVWCPSRSHASPRAFCVVRPSARALLSPLFLLSSCCGVTLSLSSLTAPSICSQIPEAPRGQHAYAGMRPAFMQRHRNQMVDGVTWFSGARLAPGVRFTNGTWGPRAFW